MSLVDTAYVEEYERQFYFIQQLKKLDFFSNKNFLDFNNSSEKRETNLQPTDSLVEEDISGEKNENCKP